MHKTEIETNTPASSLGENVDQNAADLQRGVLAAPQPLWLLRLLIGLVLAWNVQAALLFIWSPQSYAAGFELSGAVGDAMVRGMGVLFLMWNVPYVFAFWHPLRFSVSLLQAVIMQAIGLAGESFIYLNLPLYLGMARSSVLRFIAFDAAGLVLLGAALWLVRRRLKHEQSGL